MFSLETLQFEQLSDLFAQYAKTPLGTVRFAEMNPHKGRLALEDDLKALREAIELENEEIQWYFSELDDPSEAISILRIENASIEPGMLLEVAELLAQALAARAVITSNREDAPVLFAIVETLPSELSKLAANIKKKILPTGEIDDSASPELNRIRREINSMRGRITKTLEALMRKKGDAIQDSIVTLRNDRFVIPVKSDFTGKVNGVAHGASSSGATVFIEPLETIEANNELQKLKSKEESEIARILFSLTSELRENLSGIEKAAEVVGELDFVKAKMVFARNFDAVIPEVSESLDLEFIDARHPLLEESLRGASVQGSKFNVQSLNKSGALKTEDSLTETEGDDLTDFEPGTLNLEQEVVPSSFSLSKKNSVMIISGANAGGKTVVLKTAGLLSLMAVSGLPVPAKSAKVPFYASVLADIGDHQSLSANLSTFSSHISNIASMIDNLQTPALILLDEVGTGTDPDEGSALGVALVDHFRRAGGQVIASTHYKGLKTYAANDEDVINASVEFDEKTLQPTYRLLMGLAGASSGLEIARRFGIRDEIIASAHTHLDKAAQKSAEYLRELQKEARQAADMRKALEDEREVTAEKYAKLDVEFHQKERKRREDFEKELDTVVGDFEKEAREFLKSVKDKKERKKLEKDLAGARSRLKRKAATAVSDLQSGGTVEKAEPSEAPNETIKPSDAPIEKGSRVRLKAFGTIGTVEKIDGDTARISVGSLKMKQNLSDLESVEERREPKKSGKKKRSEGEKLDTNFEDMSSSSEINLIGMTTLDAEDEVDRFLDDSYAAKIMRVRIIHGMGTGALRNAVHGFLKGHPHVESFGLAPQNEGGNGATIVELKA
ncbi:MAG: endonuclease MutS2 [Pyrinomonadaceae bacterium]|nr:endonuclease MutS2 [Pyrinomonadaceae bacterium]